MNHTISSAQHQQAAPLGTIAKSASPPPCLLPRKALPSDPISLRFLLQSGSRELLPSERVSRCLRVPHSSSVEVLHSPEKKKAIFKGLQTCGSVWMCPCCATRVSEHRRNELAAAIIAWRKMGGKILFITYTIRHKKMDRLEPNVDGLLLARKRMRSGKAAEQFNSEFGVIGSVRALEVTHGSNGWHPHIHELLFVPSEVDLGAIERKIRLRWAAVLKSSGMRSVNEHSIDLTDADDDIAQYVAAFGYGPSWTAEHELTKAVVKKGKMGNRAPMGLLEDYCLGDEEAGALFAEYAGAFKGRRQLSWSRHLREILIPDLDEKTDEEISAETREYPVLMASINLYEWRVIVANDARADIIRIAGEGDRVQLLRYIADLVVAARQLDLDLISLPPPSPDRAGSGCYEMQCQSHLKDSAVS